jgi:hypothetical protein
VRHIILKNHRRLIRKFTPIPPGVDQLPLRIEQRTVIAAAVAPDRLAGAREFFNLARREHSGTGVPLHALI